MLRTKRKNVPARGANVRNVRALSISPRDRTLVIARVVLAGLLVGLVAACSGGDDGGIRIAAVTSTPTASPTATSTALEQVTPTPLPVPELPSNVFAAGRMLEGYLKDGDADIEGCLPEIVREWALAPEVDGVRCALVDLDGDRLDEFVFLVSYGTGAEDISPYPADLWFFEDEGAGYRFFNSARALANASTAALRIRSTEDLTSDGLADVVMTWDECGASTCTTHVSIASFHNGSLENLAPEDASIESLQEFTMEGGSI